MIVSLPLCQAANAQMPQPMQGANFGTTVPPSGSYLRQNGVLPAQYQRFGKPTYTPQRRSNGTSGSRTLVDRLMRRKPESDGPTIDYNRYSVSGTQPPLQNYQPGSKPNAGLTAKSKVNKKTQQQSNSQQPKPPQAGIVQPRVPSLKDARSPSSVRNGNSSSVRSAPQAGSKPMQSVPDGVFPKSTTTGVARSNPNAIPSQPPRSKPEQSSTRVNKQASNLPELEKLPPKVARVPLPMEKDEPTSSELSASTDKTSGAKAGPQKGDEPQDPSKQDGKSSASEATVAKNGAVRDSQEQIVSTEQGQPQGLASGTSDSAMPSIPSQLVGSQSAAKSKAGSKLSAQYLAGPPKSKVSQTPAANAENIEVSKSLAPPTLSPNRSGADSKLAMPDLPLPNSAPSGQPSVTRLPPPQLPSNSELAVEMQKTDTEGTPSTSVDNSLDLDLPLPTSNSPSEEPADLSLQGQPQKPVESISNVDANSVSVPVNPSSELPSLRANSAQAIPELGQPTNMAAESSKAPVAVRPRMDLRVSPPRNDYEPGVTIRPKSAAAGVAKSANSAGPARIPNPLDSPNTLGAPAQNLGTTPVANSDIAKGAQSNNKLRRPFGLPDKGAFSVAASARLNMQTPSLQVLLNGPEIVPVASPVNYEVVAINRDSVDLNGLILRLEIPAGVVVQSIDKQADFDVEKAPNGAALLTWGVDRLAATEEIRAQLTIVTRKATDFAIGLDWTLIPISNQASVRVIAPVLKAEVLGPNDVVFGQSNTYRLRVKNEGEAAAEDVQLQITVPSLGTHRAELGTLAPGQAAAREFDIAFQQEGIVKLQAVAIGANNLRAPNEAEIQVRRQDVVAQLTAPTLVYHGNAVAYRVVLTNQGDANSQICKARLQLPVGAKPNGLPYGATVVNGGLVWELSPIAPGESAEYNFQLRLAGDGEHIASFECPDDVGNRVVANARTMLQSIADLKLIVSDPVAPAPVDSEVTYELTLTNRGSKAASNVRVIAQFSKGIEPTRATGEKYRIVPGQVFFESIPRIGPGDSVKLKILAKATADGMHRFRAEVRSDSDASRLVQEESTQFMGTNTRIAAPQSSSPLR
ncbi:MAG: CARDB domain-containing protein [Planctomycetota bacterium]